MAISRILPQSLHRTARPHPLTALLSHHRHRSSKTQHAHIIKVDLDPSSSSHPDSPEAATAEAITLGIKQLEEAIQSIIVHRAAPSWLPFLPGYSYWVPPGASSIRSHSAGSLVEVIGKLASSWIPMNLRGSTYDSLSEDERMSYTSKKGWPSSAFFIEGTSPIHPVILVEVELKSEDSEKNTDDTPNNDEEH